MKWKRYSNCLVKYNYILFTQNAIEFACACYEVLHIVSVRTLCLCNFCLGKSCIINCDVGVESVQNHDFRLRHSAQRRLGSTLNTDSDKQTPTQPANFGKEVHLNFSIEYLGACVTQRGIRESRIARLSFSSFAATARGTPFC